MTNLYLLGETEEDGEIRQRADHVLVARTGRRISEIRMLNCDLLDQLTRPVGQDAADGVFVVKLRYQQTKIE
jgi:hypothetical protein